MSGYGPYGFDPDIDTRDASRYPSAYRAIDFRDGRFGVFLIHRDTREWWRLVAVFSTWERAVAYAGVENDCMDSNFDTQSFELVIPLVPTNETGKAELSPAPETLPPEPPTNIQSPLQAEGSPYAKLWTRDYSQTLPLSDRFCERPECGYRIPTKRAEHKLTKYCSPECAEIVAKERALAKKATTQETTTINSERVRSDNDGAVAPEDIAASSIESDTWTDERVAQLRSLVAEGLSYSEIGARLGVTKNAALGKANRLGLSPPTAKEPESDTVGEQDEIARFIAERGVTKLPPDPRLP